METGSRLRDAGWQQGAVVPLELLPTPRISPEPVQEEGKKAVVASHDCDLLSHDLAKEPYAELVCAMPSSGSLGNVRHGKSPRELALDIDGEPHVLSMNDKCRIDREALAEYTPATLLDDDSRYTFRRWLAQRYQRTGFPDAFNSRIAQVQSKVMEKLKKRGGDLTAIYLIIPDVELDEGEAYSLDIVASVGVETAGDDSSMRVAQEVVDWLDATFSSCRGVDVVQSRLVSEAEISLADLRHLKRWDVESVSLRESPTGVIAPV